MGCKCKGFTLIELLVVISIIALLMAILVPTMSKVRKHAKEVVCQAHLHQWSVCFSAYTGDYDGHFSAGGCSSDVGGHRIMGEQWMQALLPYYREPDLRCCPEAPKKTATVDNGLAGNIFEAWGIFDTDAGAAPVWGFDGDYGSYGISRWIYDIRSNGQPGGWGGTEKYWRHCNVRSANQIPLFADCCWVGTWPDHTDQPPAYQGQRIGEGGFICDYCIPRHFDEINAIFVDFSSRKVGLKELWRLRWHRSYNVNADPPVWPEWMKRFKDYN